MRALAVTLLAAAVACNPFAMWGDATAQRDAAKQASERFHLQLDLGQFDSIGTVVRLVYGTTFAKEKATETFTWRVRDGKPALLGYNINSPALLRAMVDEKN